MLIDHLWSNEPGLTDELAAILNELTTLHRAEHGRVALRARQVMFYSFFYFSFFLALMMFFCKNDFKKNFIIFHYM